MRDIVFFWSCTILWSSSHPLHCQQRDGIQLNVDAKSDDDDVICDTDNVVTCIDDNDIRSVWYVWLSFFMFLANSLAMHFIRRSKGWLQISLLKEGCLNKCFAFFKPLPRTAIAIPVVSMDAIVFRIIVIYSYNARLLN